MPQEVDFMLSQRSPIIAGMLISIGLPAMVLTLRRFAQTSVSNYCRKQDKWC